MTPSALRERLKAEYIRLEALVTLCESDLHRTPIGCPTCHRDERQMDLLRDAAALLASWETQLRALKTIRDKFQKDEDDGYRSRDRQYAIALANKALETVPSPSEARWTAEATLPLEAIGHTGVPFDPSNHHNALACPYCNPNKLMFAEARGTDATEAAPEIVGRCSHCNHHAALREKEQKCAFCGEWEWIIAYVTAEPLPPSGGETPR